MVSEGRSKRLKNQDWLFLRKIKFFEAFSDEVLEKIYRLGEVMTFNKDSHIIVEGEDTSGLYFILEGSVDVYKNAIESLQTGFRIATLEVGSVFGELSLVDRQPRSATVAAAEPVMMFFLDSTIWNRFLLDNVDIEIQFLRNLSFILSNRVRVLDRELTFSHKLLWKMRFSSEKQGFEEETAS
jgi:CRP-like cAMP-binding protein